MKKALVFITGLLSGLCFIGVAVASRNTTTGTYSLPAGNPVVTGTTITSTWANTTLNDIKTELTDSLSRSGYGAMLAPLKAVATTATTSGTVGAPAYTFSGETTSGIWKAGTNDVRMSIAGVDQMKWTTTGPAVPNYFTVGYGHTNPAVTGSGYELRVNQRVQPISPAPSDSGYPLGHDLWLMSRGSADIHISPWSLMVTASTSVGAPGSVAVTVATPVVCEGNDTAACEALSGTATASFCPPSKGCSIIVDEGTSSEETITSANWSITNSTTITATFANTHTQPYKIRQHGLIDMNTRAIGINRVSAADNPVALYDRSNVDFLILPNSTSGTFPKTAIQVKAVITGNNGGNDDLLFRHATSSSCTKTANSANTANAFQICEASDAGRVYVGNPSNNSIRIDGTSDAGRIFGGGTNTSLIMYGLQTGTGTGGIVRIRNNSTDENDFVKVDTAAANERTTVNGELYVSAGYAGGGATHPGNLVVANSITAAGLTTTPNGASITGGLIIGGGTAIAKSAYGSTTTDLASIPNGAGGTIAVTVTGATAGSVCVPGMPAAADDLLVSCNCTAADTCEIRYYNFSGGAIDPASATYGVRVFNN